MREFSEDRSLLFATRRGVVKKTTLSAYGNVRVTGVNAINIAEDDELIDVQLTGGDDEVILATRDGMAIRFHESNAREMGRATSGVRGISLATGDVVVGMIVVREESRDTTTALVVTENGRGKRTRIDDYRLQRRGGKGVINFKLTPGTGKVIAIKQVQPEDELMLITRNGVVNRQRVGEIRVIGRNTQGVRVMSLDDGDTVVDVACLVPEEEEVELVATNADGTATNADGAPPDDDGAQDRATAPADAGDEPE